MAKAKPDYNVCYWNENQGAWVQIGVAWDNTEPGKKQHIKITMNSLPIPNQWDGELHLYSPGQ